MSDTPNVPSNVPSNVPPAPEDDDAMAVSRLHPGLVAMTLYVSGELSIDEMRKVAEQFEGDDEFRAQALPVLHLWSMPLPLLSESMSSLRDEFPAGPPRRTNPIWVAIAKFGDWIGALPRFVQVFGSVFLILAGVFVWSGMGGRKELRSAEEGRAGTYSLRNTHVVEAKTVPVNVTFGEGVVARVLPGAMTRLTYTATPPLGDFSSHTYYAALDGTALFEVLPGWSVELHTFAGAMHLDPGYYAVACDPGCDATLIHVGVGHIHIHTNFSAVADTMSAFDGQMLYAAPRKRPVVRTDSVNFPSLAEMNNIHTKP